MSKVQTAEIIIAAHNRTQVGIAEAEKGLKGLSSTLGGMAKGFAGLWAVDKVVQGTMEGINMMGDAADKAANLNMMGSTLLMMGRAAEEAGAGMDDMVGMLRKVDENTASALSGNKAMQENFKRLGISATTLRGVAPERALEMLAKAYKGAHNDAAAFDAILNITGAKTAPKMLDVLRQLGNEGLAGLEERFGGVSEAAVRAADVSSDALHKLWDDIKLGMAELAMDAAVFYGALDPKQQAKLDRWQGEAAQGDINRRTRAILDAMQAEDQARREMEDAQHKIYMEKTKQWVKEEELYAKQEAAAKRLWEMADDRIDKEWELLAAQADAPAARSMQTMSGADLNSFVQQQSFQANEDRRKAEHDRRVERLQNELLTVTKEMRDFAKANGIKEWD